MKKLLIVLFFVSMPAFAFEAAVEVEEPNAVSTRLCDFWRYQSGGNGYACSYLSRRVNLVEARDYEMTIRNLEARIRDLEARVQDLAEVSECR